MGMCFPFSVSAHEIAPYDHKYGGGRHFSAIHLVWNRWVDHGNSRTPTKLGSWKGTCITVNDDIAIIQLIDPPAGWSRTVKVPITMIKRWCDESRHVRDWFEAEWQPSAWRRLCGWIANKIKKG
jgi:hypothetical protein